MELQWGGGGRANCRPYFFLCNIVWELWHWHKMLHFLWMLPFHLQNLLCNSYLYSTSHFFYNKLFCAFLWSCRKSRLIQSHCDCQSTRIKLYHEALTLLCRFTYTFQLKAIFSIEAKYFIVFQLKVTFSI